MIAANAVCRLPVAGIVAGHIAVALNVSMMAMNGSEGNIPVATLVSGVAGDSTGEAMNGVAGTELAESQADFMRAVGSAIKTPIA